MKIILKKTNKKNLIYFLYKEKNIYFIKEKKKIFLKMFLKIKKIIFFFNKKIIYNKKNYNGYFKNILNFIISFNER